MKLANKVLEILNEDVKSIDVFAPDKKVASKIVSYLKTKKLSSEEEDQGDYILITIDTSKLNDSETKKLGSYIERTFDVDINID